VNGYRLGLLHGALLVGLILVVWVACHAQVSVSVFGLSKHSEPGYCEVNPGLGLNYQISENVRFGHGRYQNSKCSYTNITGLSYCPVKVGGFCFGMALVRLTGYRPSAIYAPLPIGAYTIDKHNAIDFFAVTSGDLTVAGAAWRYSF
jgi:hypothetical protein